MAPSVEDVAALAVIRAELGIVTELHLCPRCQRTWTRPVAGHVAICEACTCAEVGLSRTENAQRIAYGFTIKRWLQRDPDEPLPAIPWRRWRQLVGR